jgi:MFS transporter
VLLLLFWHVPESRDENAPPKLDWLGALLATTALGGIVYGLIESSILGFHHPMVLSAIAGGCCLLIGFIVIEARLRNPMLPLSIFRSMDFTGANLLTLFLYAALGGALFFFPLNLIQIQGYSATAAGAAFLPFIAIMFSLSRWAGKLVPRYGPRKPLLIGPAIAATGFALFAFPSIVNSYWTSFFPAVVVLGLGMTISVAPLTTTVMNSVDVSRSGIASGINNAVSRAASLLAVAVFGIVMVHIFNQQFDRQLADLDIAQGAKSELKAQRSRLAGIQPPGNLDSKTKGRIRKGIQASFIAGFRAIMIVAACLALVSSLLAGFTIRR